MFNKLFEETWASLKYQCTIKKVINRITCMKDLNNGAATPKLELSFKSIF